MIRILKIIERVVQLDSRKYSTSFASKMSDALNQKKEEKSEFKKKEKYIPRYKRAWGEPRKQNSESSEPKKPFLDSNGEKIKRRKCAILLAYSGVNFFGMQRNPEMKTIEEELLKAMLKNKLIDEEEFNQPQDLQFQRAARTDKGVSACQQVVSVKLPDVVDIKALNADLPEDIRVFSVKRVTKGFNSKNTCDARTYSYTLPTIAFVDHKDEQPIDMENFRIPDDRFQKFNEILKMYEGTLNFHNFTSKKEFVDPSAKRFIMEMQCDKPFLSDTNVEFAVIRVKGQSFMLHQIRKMVGLAIAIIRGHTEPETITKALTAERIDIPMAPGLGLVLDKIHYEKYNHRYGSDGMHESLEWKEVQEELNDYFLKHIFKTILNAEIETKSMLSWMETLGRHSYDVRDADKNKEESGNVSDNSKNSDD